MPIPNKFKAGETAASAELNANFTYLEGLLGEMSNEKELDTGKDFKFGSAGYIIGSPQKGFLSANSTEENVNVENTARGFLNLSWNAQKNETTRRWYRVNNLSGSSVLEIGARGIVFASTDKTTGDFASQLTPLFGVQNQDKADSAEVITPHIYMRQDVPIISTYVNPNNPSNKEDWTAENSDTQDFKKSLQRRRLTYVLFDVPKTVMENQSMAKGTQEINAMSFGVPKGAAMVELLVYVTATTNSGAGLIITPKISKSHRKYALIAHAYGGAYANVGRTAAQGHVAVYSGIYKKKGDSEDQGVQGLPLVLEATEAFSEVSIYVQGYWV